MTLEELNRELLSDEERLVSSLREYKNAKATLRKARITSVTNKLLAPYRRFQINKAIAKYEAMIEKLEKKREKEIRRAEKLQEKEEKLVRKQAKEDFKAAVRDKKKEDINKFVTDKKDDVINFGKEISSKVSMASSFVSNVKNTAIEKLKENTTIDLRIKNAIEDLKMRQFTNKINREYEKEQKEIAAVKQEELNAAIKYSEEVNNDYKRRDVPFSNIKEKTQKASSRSSYKNKATNRVVKYFKSKRDNVMSTVNDKVLETEFNTLVNAYIVMGKVTNAKSRIVTTFNNKISEFKDGAKNKFGDVIVAIEDKKDSVGTTLNQVKGDIAQSLEDRKVRNERKKDMVAALREQEEKNLSIKRAQLDSMRQAIEATNNTGDIFENVSSLNVSRIK